MSRISYDAARKRIREVTASMNFGEAFPFYEGLDRFFGKPNTVNRAEFDAWLNTLTTAHRAKEG